MGLALPVERLRVFTLAPRHPDAAESWSQICEVIRLSELHGATGMLIFTGNDVFVEPWLVANELLARTKALSPLVAVNPAFMHPFTAARFVASLTTLHGRTVFLNLVTGTALSHLRAMGDRDLTHDERYERLVEYVEIVDSLVTSRKPVTASGKHFSVASLQLPTPVPEALRPAYFLAGQSGAALAATERLRAVSMQMLPPTLAEGLGRAGGVNLGIVTRADEAEAWRAARARYPEDAESQAMLAFSMTNTDAEWKRRLHVVATQESQASPGFWLAPFRNFLADNPTFVGSHARVGRLLASLVRAGVEAFILDIPPDAEEFENVAEAFACAAEELSSS